MSGDQRHQDFPGAATAFGTSAEYTMGVEEELMVLDPGTLGLTPRADEIVEAISHPDVKPEIRQSMIEIASVPVTTTEDLTSDLLRLRRAVVGPGSRLGLSIAAAGTHPFSRAESQELTDRPRYRYVAGVSGWVGRRSTAVCGTHVHVSIGSEAKALDVMEALVADLPVLIALAGSSPLWEGQDTGFSSARLAVRSELPRSGLPPQFDSLDHYHATLATLGNCGLVPDPSFLWWDLRLQPRLGTLEVRVMDAQPSVYNTVALAGLVQALVRHHGQQWDDGRRVRVDRFIAEENRFQALRNGLSATFADDRGQPSPARASVDALFERVRDVARQTGSGWVLDHLADLARRGGPATAIRDTFLLTDDAVAVARALVRQAEDDLVDNLATSAL